MPEEWKADGRVESWHSRGEEGKLFYSKERAGVMVLCCGETAWPRNASLHGGMGGTGKDGIIRG
jgi:hypothetical protein